MFSLRQQRTVMLLWPDFLRMSRLEPRRIDPSLWSRSSNIVRARHMPTEVVLVTGVPADAAVPLTPVDIAALEEPVIPNLIDAVDEVVAVVVEIVDGVDVVEEASRARQAPLHLPPLPPHPPPINIILKI